MTTSRISGLESHVYGARAAGEGISVSRLFSMPYDGYYPNGLSAS